MTKTLSRVLWMQVACLGLWPLSLLAGVPDPAANLLACRQGRPSCDRQQEAIEVNAAVRARNLAECRGGGERCDYSLLSPSEAAGLAAVEHRRNHTACASGRGYCDRSRLTAAEAASMGRQP